MNFDVQATVKNSCSDEHYGCASVEHYTHGSAARDDAPASTERRESTDGSTTSGEDAGTEMGSAQTYQSPGSAPEWDIAGDDADFERHVTPERWFEYPQVASENGYRALVPAGPANGALPMQQAPDTTCRGTYSAGGAAGYILDSPTSSCTGGGSPSLLRTTPTQHAADTTPRSTYSAGPANGRMPPQHASYAMYRGTSYSADYIVTSPPSSCVGGSPSLPDFELQGRTLSTQHTSDATYSGTYSGGVAGYIEAGGSPALSPGMQERRQADPRVKQATQATQGGALGHAFPRKGRNKRSLIDIAKSARVSGATGSDKLMGAVADRLAAQGMASSATPGTKPPSKQGSAKPVGGSGSSGLGCCCGAAASSVGFKFCSSCGAML